MERMVADSTLRAYSFDVLSVAKAAFRVAALCCIAVAACGTATSDRSASTIDKYAQQLARPLDAGVQQTLEQIEGRGRQLLALRAYLRAKDSLAARWSWSQAEIDAYRQSTQYQDMMAEIGRITAQFEKSNPGFTLYANSDVRSLDEQIAKWNSNAAVGAIADQLLAAAGEQLKESAKSSAAVRQTEFREFLLAWQPQARAPLAAPGLSLHGRGRALDFQVQQGNRIVAGTDMGTIADVWIGQGWAHKLAAAITAASSKFKGPLSQPDEPWHFEYIP